MTNAKWKLSFRNDQCEFIVAAMDYIIARADEHISGLRSEAFNSFAAERTKERALEIRQEITSVIGYEPIPE